MALITKVSPTDLQGIVLGTVQQVFGCESVTTVSIQKLWPMNPTMPNWDVYLIMPQPNEEACVAACRAVVKLQGMFRL